MRARAQTEGRSVEAHLEVDKSLTVSEAHGLVTSFEEVFLEAVSDVDNVVTHIDPVGEVSAVQQSEPADEGPVRQALETIRTEYGPLFAPRNLAVRRNGDALSVSFVLPMPPAMSIAEAHATGEQVEKALRTRLAALERVVIRVE